MSNTKFEPLGFFAIFGAGIVLAMFIQEAVATPDVLRQLSQLSPWAGAHAQALAWTAIAFVLVTVLALPPILLRRDLSSGGSRLGSIGFVMSLFLLLPSIGFLLAAGWFGAKHLLGQ